jgi:hypothetical protein
VLVGISTNAQGQKVLEVRLQDTGSGLGSVTFTTFTNAIGAVQGSAGGITTVPTTVQLGGTTSPVPVTATKQDPSLSSQLALRVLDLAGSVTLCHPVLVDLSREAGKPETHRFSGIKESERYLQLANGDRGVQQVVLAINGQRYRVRDFDDGEVRTFDLGGARRPDSNNVVEVELRGKPGGMLMLYIGDLLPPGAELERLGRPQVDARPTRTLEPTRTARPTRAAHPTRTPEPTRG